MKSRIHQILPLAAITGLALTAASNQATAATWANVIPGDGDINNALNWTGGLPSDAGGNGAIVATTALVINQVFDNGGDDRSEYLISGIGGLTIAAGGSFTYLGDGLLGSTAFSVGATTITHTGGTLTQDGGGAGLLVGHNQVGTYNISGGNLLVQGTAPSLTINFSAGAGGSSLNISDSGQVDVEANVDLAINLGGTLNVTGGGLLVWHDRTVAEATFGGTVNAAITQVGSDVHFTAIPEPSSVAFLGLAGLGLILRRRRK